MGLSMRQRQAVTRELALSYRRAGKKKRGEILTWLCEVSRYNRSYAGRALRQRAKPKVVGRLSKGGSSLTIVEDERTKAKRRAKTKKYGREVFLALKRIWAICDCICGKRLHPFLPEIVPVLERFGELRIDEETRKKLLEISPATIDRLLASERRKFQLKGRSTTKPGTLLKNQIPVRTFSDWDDERPGFLEVDLVSHDGGNTKGDFTQTLDATDISTTWTETKAVKNKAQKWVFEALQEIKDKLPFKVLGLDSDNGFEFINAHLLRFCEKEKITFTRSRPYRKNDNCYVEQKNYSVVRRTVGYLRYDTEEELKVLNKLYSYLREYTNFFQPTMKLVEKTRVGAKVKKRYDQAKTPYQRVLESPHIPEQNKERLEQEYATLNPAELKRKITKLQNKLIKLAGLKEELRREQRKENKDFEYISNEAMNNHFEYIFT
ncbi:MAG TPA: transposase [Actinobacteria bacterium]|nr:transposase [Actinomycetota bacterium]